MFIIPAPTTAINIQMLGGFRISSGEYHVEELTKRAPKFWKMLQYLIVNRHKSIPQEELIYAIWPDSQEGDPGNAIRNMVFRIRTALADSGMPPGREMLLLTNGGYAWNNSLDCVVDFEEFEKLYNRASSNGIPAQARLEMLLQAIELYKGDFLPNASSEQWAMPLVSYYRAIYFKCVHTALGLLMEQEQYSQAEMVSKRALMIDRFDEKVHEHHLNALMLQGKLIEALGEYQKMEISFYEDMGVNPSEALRELYTRIQRSHNDQTRPLEDLTQEWVGSARFPGAYYCGYGIFRTMYQIEARSIERSGKSVYVCSLEVPGNSTKTLDIMRRLYDVIQGNLRKGDTFTQASPNQYLIMLQGLTYEDCKMLCKRITRALGKNYRSYHIKSTVKPIIPISGAVWRSQKGGYKTESRMDQIIFQASISVTNLTEN